jgi:hypothetical protein
MADHLLGGMGKAAILTIDFKAFEALFVGFGKPMGGAGST